MTSYVSVAGTSGWWVGVYDKKMTSRKRSHRVIAWGLTEADNLVPFVAEGGLPHPLNWSSVTEALQFWHEDGREPPSAI